MPLSKKRMRARKKLDKKSNLAKFENNQSKGNSNPNRFETDKQEKLVELRKLIDKAPVQPEKIAIYNPAIHKPGDRVLVRQGKKLIQPHTLTSTPWIEDIGEFVDEASEIDIDADGNTVPDYW